jgi:hypothetical protein
MIRWPRHAPPRSSAATRALIGAASLVAPVRRNERNSRDALKHFRFLAIRAVKGTKIKNANTGEARSPVRQRIRDLALFVDTRT